MKKRLLNLLCISLFPCVVFFSAGLSIFYANPLDFCFIQKEAFLGLFIVATLGFIGILLLQLPWIGSKYFNFWNLFCFGLGICVFLESILFTWKTDNTVGIIAGYQDRLALAWLEIAVFALVFGLIGYFRNLLIDDLYLIAAIFMAVTLVPLFGAWSSYDESLYRNKILTFDTSEQYTFSNEQNVLIIILDSFGEDFFRDVRQAGNGVVEKNFKDFTHFSRLLSLLPSTLNALPVIYSGSENFEKNNDWGTSRSGSYIKNVHMAAQEETSLFHVLPQNGYRCYAYPLDSCVFPMDDTVIHNLEERPSKIRLSMLLADDILPHTFYRLVPLFLKKQIFHTTHVRQWHLYGWIQRTFYGETIGMSRFQAPVSPGAQGKTFSETECSETGTPEQISSVTSESMFRNLKTLTVIPGKRFLIFHLEGPHDQGEELQDYQREKYVQVAKQDIHDLHQYLQALQAAGVYENSYIIVLGDHGAHQDPVNSFNPFLLVKRPHEKHDFLQENDAVVLMRDIAPSILTNLGYLKSPKGYSMETLSPEQHKEREMLWNKLMGK